MTSDSIPPRTGLRRLRLLLWFLVGLVLVAMAAMTLMHRSPSVPQAQSTTVQSGFGGPFTLVGADSKPFPSSRLQGKPYALYFGYTRCGDTCPTTLSRLVKLRAVAGRPDALNIVFVTIDPANDGPTEVGQYAGLFNSPIIGLTGSAAQIDAVKKQFGTYAKPEPGAGKGMVMINHTATVLLFDRDGKFTGTITSDEPDSDATAKLKTLTGA
ncbi:SCO family protein [Sphingomonas sp.]|uniref:SCO family protein n=1 Tax=Sphingomonas sp. TaxID=28214 RepID=UPI0025D8D185|nr:SCO family protein [Sphingomonas sp.]MBV9527078.1 SCO family protein [Sphingomonas sp.]